MHEIELRGPDGGDLLGFMAALGSLRVLSLREPGVRMHWTDAGEGWMPVVHHPRISAGEGLVREVASLVCGESTINEAWRIGNDLTLPREEFRKHLQEHAAKAKSDQREGVDFLTAFGSEVYGIGPKKEQVGDTEFRTMSGAGNQHFLAFMRELALAVNHDQIRRTLLEPWDYADRRPSMRWSWTDYRPHALRADDPSTDPIRTMRGANRLALEALPLFPTMAANKRVRTPAFRDGHGEMEITWPVWTCPIDVRTAQSLIALKELHAAEPAESAGTLGRRGIGQVFRARRFTEGKYRNFSRAKALL
ncbi:MAG: hypothetical protein JO323_15200 [Acidobacteriia bacterium]|nr:hypothetical protein [Terriglobia bacterium]